MPTLYVQKTPAYVLTSDSLRRGHVKSLFQRLYSGPDHIKPVIWHGITDDARPFNRGAKGFLSIVSAIADRMDGPFRPFILFEDDIVVENLYKDIPGTLTFSYPPDADALYLGISSVGLRFASVNNHTVRLPAQPEYNKQWCRVLNMFSTHAVAVMSRRYMNYLMRCWQYAIGYNYGAGADKLVFDVPVGLHMKDYNVYALRNPLFYQQAGVLKGQEALTHVAFADTPAEDRDLFFLDTSYAAPASKNVHRNGFYDFEDGNVSVGGGRNTVRLSDMDKQQQLSRNAYASA